MPDGTPSDLAEAARLDERARAILAHAPAAAATQLHDAWCAAVQRQDRAVDDAIVGSLSLLPRILRKRVLKLLTRGRR